MGDTRWIRWLGPGIVAMAAVGVVASATATAGAKPWTPRACPGSAAEIGAAARATTARPERAAGSPWFRLDPVVDRTGTLTGQRLVVGLVGGPRASVMSLPPESFAAGPFGRVVLVGRDDGTRSAVDAVDVVNACSWPVAASTDVIRRATLDQSGSTLFEMRVARWDRADQGIWRRPIGAGEPRRVLAAPTPDERFGPTFSTEFAWDEAGRRLAVQSCGQYSCRTRLLTASGDPAGSTDDPGEGPLVGIDGDLVVTYAACGGLPCPVVVTDTRSGARRTLVADGGPALLVGTPDGPRLVDEAVAPDGVRLRSTALSGEGPTDLGRVPSDRGLLTGPGAGAAIRPPDGWVVLAPDGRLPDDPSAPRPILRRISDGLTVLLDEAVR